MSENATVSELITLGEASQMTGIEVKRLRRMITSGDLAYAQKLPGPTGAYLLSRDVVTALAEKLASEAEATARSIRSALAEERAS